MRAPTLNSFAVFADTTDTSGISDLIKSITPAASQAVAGAVNSDKLKLNSKQKATLTSLLAQGNAGGAQNSRWFVIGGVALGLGALYWFYLRKK